MKRIILLAVAVYAFAFNANAQGYEMPDNEVSVNVGYGTHPHLALSFSEVFLAIIGDAGSDKSTGAYSAMYLRNLNKHFAVGASATYEDIYRISKKENKRYDQNFITFMPTVRAYWFRGKYFGMYSRAAAGVSLNFYEGFKDGSTSEKQNKCDTFFAFQLAPVSFEVGSNKVSAFVELGYGFQGFGNAGIRLGF